MIMNRPCKKCGGRISDERLRRRATYCGEACADSVGQNNSVAAGRLPNGVTMSTSTTGAVSELLAAVDLTRHGFDVFRAISPACPCDIIALRGGVSMRVEVRSGCLYKPTGKISFPFGAKDAGRQDVFAVVVGAAVHYLMADGRTPWLPSQPMTAPQSIGVEAP